MASWIETARKEYENCQFRKWHSCKKCITKEITGGCESPSKLERLRQETMKGISEETIKLIADEKEEIVNKKISGIILKSDKERSWIERRYLELWMN